VPDNAIGSLTFAAGFFGVRTYQTDYRQEIIIEENNFNNTLAPYDVCPNVNTEDVGNFGGIQGDKWAKIYLKDAQKRLQPMIKGFNLTIPRLIDMQEMCAYEVITSFTRSSWISDISQTVALGYSKFCDLFTEEEWEGYEYYVGMFPQIILAELGSDLYLQILVSILSGKLAA
jgi:hypothetical protein